MPITKKLERLIADAGRAAAREHDDREQRQRDHDARRESEAREFANARDRAEAAAVEVWTWRCIGLDAKANLGMTIDLRNAIRAELSFGKDLDVDRARAWIVGVKMREATATR